MDSYSFSFVVAAILVAALFAYLTGEIANKKGYDFVGYAILGLFLPIIGLIVAAAIPDRRSQQAMADMVKQSYAKSNADELLKYKALLDSGAITQAEFDRMKNDLLTNATPTAVIDDNNPIEIEIIHLKNGRISVVTIENGKKSQYPKNWDNLNCRDKNDVSKEIAEEIEKDTGRKVLYKSIIK